VAEEERAQLPPAEVSVTELREPISATYDGLPVLIFLVWQVSDYVRCAYIEAGGETMYANWEDFLVDLRYDHRKFSWIDASRPPRE
jgi:hypothetical protein